MPKKPKLLIAISDGEHARIVRPGPSNVLRTERVFNSTAAHERSADLGSDRPGASFHSDASAHHALAPRHDLHDLEKEKFSRFVAEQLNEMSGEEDFDALVLVAPANRLHVLRDALNTVTHAKISGILHKDLVKVPDGELWPHLREWVLPVLHLRQA
jgi:protein required for attachment to host cells